MTSLRTVLFTLIALGALTAGLLTIGNHVGARMEEQAVAQTLSAKDVAADILPPPLYLIELRLVMGMAADGSMPLDQATTEQARLVKEYQERISHWQAHPPYGLETHLLGEQHAQGQKFIAASSKVLAALQTTDNAATKQALVQAHAYYLAHRKAVDETVKLSSAFAKASMDHYDTVTTRFTWVSFTLFGLTTLGMILFGRWAIQAIWRTTGGEPADVAKVVNAVAAGDLSIAIAVKPGDQTSIMAATARMCTQLSAVVATIRCSSQALASGSQQIAGSNMDLSVRTEQQAANLEETSSAMEQFNGTVQTTAGTAVQASNLAHSASEVAQHGAEVMGQVVNTMGEISLSSRKIADITSVIDGIAFQTNILALNAAVEAARAGEQGRGFAVVASEVRSLAQRSGAAAKEINALIHSSVDKVEVGAALVTRAGETMNNIVAQVQKVTDLIGEISTATQEQTQGIRLVSASVSQLDSATQQNAAMVEESAAAASNLNELAQELVSQVSTFKL